MKEIIFDEVIFGGGIIGCSIFNKLTRIGQKCLLIEKNEDVCTGCSKANSAIIHAGFDAKPNTLKAKLNVQGNELIFKLCNELSVPVKKCGAVVVGNDLEKIKALYEQGKQNKVKNLSILNEEELHKLVPSLNKEIKYALYAKNSGIVNVFMLTVALCEEAVINGGKAVFSFTTKKIKFNKNIFEISNGKETYFAKKIINATGANFNEIALLTKTEQFNINFRRGEYLVIDKTEKDFVPLTVFNLPTNLGKGILATPTTDGNLLFGPTAENIDTYSTECSEVGINKIKEELNKTFNNPPINKTIRIFSGIRTICGDDFIIEKSKINENLINICGICSPGLSSAPAIANYVCSLLELNYKEEKILKKRKTYGELNQKNPQEISKLIAKDPKFGEIVCNCEFVSKAEVLNAIHSPLKPHTIDSIKRRLRIGAGRCQGGFCTLKLAKILSEELNIPMEEILKENKNSNICLKNKK